jgi:hypothetical protein
MPDLLKMLLLAVGATYLLFRVGCLLRSLIHAYLLWVSDCKTLDDLDHSEPEGQVGWRDRNAPCTQDSRSFSTREFFDS